MEPVFIKHSQPQQGMEPETGDLKYCTKGMGFYLVGGRRAVSGVNLGTACSHLSLRKLSPAWWDGGLEGGGRMPGRDGCSDPGREVGWGRGGTFTHSTGPAGEAPRRNQGASPNFDSGGLGLGLTYIFQRHRHLPAGDYGSKLS